MTENEKLLADDGFARRIMDAIGKYSAGDKEALAGMGVPWVDELLAELAALRAENERLRAVLKPFAWVGERILSAANDDTQSQLAIPNGVGLPNAGDWRRAAAALGGRS